MHVGVHVKYPLFLPEFNATRIFSTDFRKITQLSIIMIIRQVGAETDLAKLTVDFLQFYERT